MVRKDNKHKICIYCMFVGAIHVGRSAVNPPKTPKNTPKTPKNNKKHPKKHPKHVFASF